jgi:hypothetical protein
MVSDAGACRAIVLRREHFGDTQLKERYAGRRWAEGKWLGVGKFVQATRTPDTAFLRPNEASPTATAANGSGAISVLLKRSPA